MLFLFQKVDEMLFRFVHETLAHPAGTFFFPLFNHAAPFIPLFIVLIAWIAYRHSRKVWLVALIAVIGAILGDLLVFNPLKHLIQRPRPAVTMTDIETFLASGEKGGYSFPSSHTANAFLVASVISAFFKKGRGFALGLAAIIGFSRVYVGVHYPSDVLGSALLGWFLGIGFSRAGKKIWADLEKPEEPNLHPSTTNPIPGWLASLKSPALPFILLFSIQISRLIWAATTSLDVPLEAARLWCQVTAPGEMREASLVYFWFKIFGSSSLSLWAIPWMIQTLWIGGLAWVGWRRRKTRWLYGVIFLQVMFPLASEMSFLGSPAQIFSDSYWFANLHRTAFWFYLVLGLPILLAALFLLRSHFVSSLMTLLGFAWGIFDPSLPWWTPAVLSSGTCCFVIQKFIEQWPAFASSESGWFRAILVLAIAYGGIIGIAVYNPRFLRKLDISFLPRNHPHYVQMGWTEYIQRIQPHLTQSSIREIWTDSTLSRDKVQYLLGRNYKVKALEDLPKPISIPSEGVFYIREVYIDFTKSKPEEIFAPRNPEFFSRYRTAMNELDSWEIRRKGDPMRQFQFYLITPQKSAN